MKRRLLTLGTAAALLLSLAACSGGGSGSASGAVSGAAGPSEGPEEHALVLADGATTLDGQALAEDGPVTLTHDIVYYEDRDTYDSGDPYGEGTEADRHTAEEAADHSVVTVREAGTYRVSGTLSPGQLAVDLGEDAKRDPAAAVTLILDGADIACTVAPAVIFYNVYECDEAWTACDEEESGDYPASPDVDTSAAGARVVLADGSENQISGSYVARIYKEGTEKKLHKYDGAFYSRMSMEIDGGSGEEAGVLNITAANEGLDSELHLTINGGRINIRSQNDGINTNEDGVSVTRVNGGILQINAGLGDEGDGIDSNGWLVINGGAVLTAASDHSPDGGLDADGDILLNGGYVAALGVRNDAVSGDSGQAYMELSFASTLPAGSQVELSDPDGNALLSYATEKACQSLVFSSPDLARDTVYTLKVDGIVQQYTGNRSGGPSGRFEGMVPPDGQEPPGGFTPGQHPQDFDGQRPQPPEGFDPDNGERSERPDRRPAGEESAAPGMGSSEFILTQDVHAFSGISANAQDSGKARVDFSAQIQVDEDGKVTVGGIQASQEVDPAHVQLTVTDVPSEDYAASCLWSEGDEAIASILPEDPGTYRLTIAVTGDDSYTGASQFQFVIPEQ